MFLSERQRKLGVIVITRPTRASVLGQDQFDESGRRRFGVRQTWRWIVPRLSRAILFRFWLRYRAGIRSRKQTGMLLLNFSPERIGFLADTLFGHQLARHRCQYVVIVIESLQALIGEFALHGE